MDLPFGRGRVWPTSGAIKRFSQFPCAACNKHGPPWLVNNAFELYWEHGRNGRQGCSRFSTSTHLGGTPRAGSMDALRIDSA